MSIDFKKIDLIAVFFIMLPITLLLSCTNNNTTQLASGYYAYPVGLFNIANLTFYAASPGTTTLTIIVNLMNDTTGTAVPSSRVQSGTVTVQ
jgi:hypothetical protein